MTRLFIYMSNNSVLRKPIWLSDICQAKPNKNLAGPYIDKYRRRGDLVRDFYRGCSNVSNRRRSFIVNPLIIIMGLVIVYSWNLADANTCVFWIVEDYPISNGLDLCSLKEKIKSALLENLGILGDVSIQAYGDKNTFSDDELLRKFSDAEIKTDLLPEGESVSFCLFFVLCFIFLLLCIYTCKSIISISVDIFFRW